MWLTWERNSLKNKIIIRKQCASLRHLLAEYRSTPSAECRLTHWPILDQHINQQLINMSTNTWLTCQVLIARFFILADCWWPISIDTWVGMLVDSWLTPERLRYNQLSAHIGWLTLVYWLTVSDVCVFSTVVLAEIVWNISRLPSPPPPTQGVQKKSLSCLHPYGDRAWQGNMRSEQTLGKVIICNMGITLA